MWERIRFARYALRFERAFKTDDWAAVTACFHPDAIYVVEGSDTEWDGTTRGPEAIASFFKRMLDELDRKFDKRVPRLRGFPRVRGGVLHVPWSARYVAKTGEATLDGDSSCRFERGKIIELRDVMDPAQCRAWGALVGVTPR
jgi:ketosteroid isomerase-like protein